DVPLVEYMTIGAATNIMAISPPPSVTGATPFGGLNIGNQSWTNLFGANASSTTFQGIDNGATSLNVTSVNNNSAIKLWRADGTSTTFATLAGGDEIGRINWQGYDGVTNTPPTVRLSTFALNTWSGTDHSGYLTVNTTPSASINIVETVRFMAMGPLQ